jgi:uncharacterized protein
MSSLCISRRWVCTTILLAALLFSSAEGNSQEFPPQYPECRGRNLLVDLKTKDSQAYDRWVAAARKIPNGSAILWRIDGNGLAEPSWLFGTIHVTDPRIVNIPVSVQEAFIRSRTLAIENKLGNQWADFFNSLFAAPAMYLPENKTWEQYLTPAELKLMEEMLNPYGYSLDQLRRFQPWAAMIATIPSCEQWRVYLGLNVLDVELANWAGKAGKPVIGLETQYETARTIAQTSLAAQFRAMLAYARISEAPEDEFETTIQIYLDRLVPLFTLFEYSPFPLSADELEAFREFDRYSLDERNLTMRDRALPLIKEGKAFIAVGAAHLPGDQGLVELFRKAGYEVTPVN